MDKIIEDHIKDIKEHPEKHRHGFEELSQCCFINGAINMSVMYAHEKYASVGMNGGVRCHAPQVRVPAVRGIETGHTNKRSIR